MQTELLTCSCNCPEHHLLVAYDKEYEEIYIYQQYDHQLGIFERLKFALRYVFGKKCVYGSFHDFMVTRENFKEFSEKVNKICLDMEPSG